MAENSKIEWTDHTFNPWIGCTKVSPGCDHCYAEEMMDTRMRKAKWGSGQPRARTSASSWNKPLRWNAQHDAFFAAHGRRQRVFCASLADVFDNEVPQQWRQDLFDLILVTPNLDWLLLTKRIGNAARMLQDISQARGALMDANDNYRPLPNVWIGATIVNQDEADRDIPKLLAVPAAVRFLSMEPLLGPVDLVPFTGFRTIKCGCGFRHDEQHLVGATPKFEKCILCGQRAKTFPSLDWVIVGGESGPNARPMHPGWARTLRDQCAAAGVPFLFKQWGEWLPWLEFGRVGIEDDIEQTCYLTTIWQGDHWDKCGHPIWCDMQDNYGGGANGPDDQDQIMGRVGKKRAGRLLDGALHDGYPQE